ncbi:YigZ family protein [Helicobacter burdigaliensis]|uniref:YigZ family protein n=1 Tax=Helicobacter burdigaliensis TaxID=2315334 RepID=UPI000EF6D5BB|nr:YigZ family protein [Helicobacter burdigaliensis]
MKTLQKVISSSFEVKGSAFISYLVPIKEFENFEKTKRLEHPKAVHFVRATRFINANLQIEESFSDDGEPKGTSGMPTLKVLRGYELIEAGVLTIRYFGGTLLGTGGLVRAYTQAAKDVILKAQSEKELCEFVLKEKDSLFVSYANLSKIEYLASHFQIEITNKDFQIQGVLLTLRAKKEDLEAFKLKLEE